MMTEQQATERALKIWGGPVDNPTATVFDERIRCYIVTVLAPLPPGNQVTFGDDFHVRITIDVDSGRVISQEGAP